MISGGSELESLSVDRRTATEQVQRYAGQLDFMLNTVGAPHELDPPHPSPSVMGLIFSRRNIGGSLIGGIPGAQQMLDFCGKHGITADTELIPMQEINTAYERMVRSDVKYRFVIDRASLKYRPASAARSFVPAPPVEHPSDIFERLARRPHCHQHVVQQILLVARGKRGAESQVRAALLPAAIARQHRC